MFVHTPCKAQDYYSRRLPKISDASLHRPSGYYRLEPLSDKLRTIRDFRQCDVGTERIRGLRT